MADRTYDSYEDFVDNTAKEIMDGLDAEEKKYMIANPNPVNYHFSLGLWIRNNYIHGKKLGIPIVEPDDASHDIIQRIIDFLRVEAGIYCTVYAMQLKPNAVVLALNIPIKTGDWNKKAALIAGKEYQYTVCTEIDIVIRTSDPAKTFIRKEIHFTD